MNRITEVRESLGWSKSKLAREAEMSPSTVGLIEAGRLAADEAAYLAGDPPDVPGNVPAVLNAAGADQHAVTVAGQFVDLLAG